MDQQISKITPNYKQIYIDLVMEKFPNKLNLLERLFEKNHFSSLDILRINKMIFENQNDSQKYRAYEKTDITYILNYQKEHHLSNVKLSKHFDVSRNTISKWKKLYCDIESFM